MSGSARFGRSSVIRDIGTLPSRRPTAAGGGSSTVRDGLAGLLRPVRACSGADRGVIGLSPGVRGGNGSASGDVDAEVAGEPGQAVVVALSDCAQAPGPVSAVDLEADERGFHGRGGLEHVLGGRVGCGGGDAEVVEVREASAVDADRGYDAMDVERETVERDIERLAGGRPAGTRWPRRPRRRPGRG